MLFHQNSGDSSCLGFVMHMIKKHLFLKAKLIEFASTDALPPDERAQRRGTLESGKTANVIQILS